MGYHHHAVVEEVNERENGVIEVNVIGHGERGIERKLLESTKRSVAKVIHSNPKYDFPETKSRALRQLKRVKRGHVVDVYNLVTNNCEHFVEWCVNDVPRCLQIENSNWFMRWLICALGDKFFWAVKWVRGRLYAASPEAPPHQNEQSETEERAREGLKVGKGQIKAMTSCMQ